MSWKKLINKFKNIFSSGFWCKVNVHFNVPHSSIIVLYTELSCNRISERVLTPENNPSAYVLPFSEFSLLFRIIERLCFILRRLVYCLFSQTTKLKLFSWRKEIVQLSSCSFVMAKLIYLSFLVSVWHLCEAERRGFVCQDIPCQIHRFPSGTMMASVSKRSAMETL